MVLVVNAEGKYWDGFDWSEQGKVFLSVPAAIRSLHEQGEDPFYVTLFYPDDDNP